MKMKINANKLKIKRKKKRNTRCQEQIKVIIACIKTDFKGFKMARTNSLCKYR